MNEKKKQETKYRKTNTKTQIHNTLRFMTMGCRNLIANTNANAIKCHKCLWETEWHTQSNFR